MSPSFEEYCRTLQTEVDAIEQQAETDVRFDYLRAFNFGRSLQRLEQTSGHAWLRLRWLLFGAAAGVAVASVYVRFIFGMRIPPFTR